MNDDERAAAGRALVSHRKRFPGVCVRCGTEFPPSYNKRVYCSATCRQYDYKDRKAEREKGEKAPNAEADREQ